MLLGGKVAKPRLTPRFVDKARPVPLPAGTACQRPSSDAIFHPHLAHAGSDRGSSHEQGQKVLPRSGLGQAGTPQSCWVGGWCVCQSPRGWEAGRQELRVQFLTDSAPDSILGSQRQDSQPCRGRNWVTPIFHHLS